MTNRLREILIGSPLPTHMMAETRLSKIKALAAFSPDALSSIAYANQEIYLGLAVAGSAGLALAFPIGLTITGLLVIVALSYYQTIQGYPSGGGSYTVARENLGTTPGLVAASALLIDYLLNAAVSLTAGIAAIDSAFPGIRPYRVELALAILLLITLANLRGLRESGTFMAVPVYLFLVTYLPMLAYGLVRLWLGGPVPPVQSALPQASAPLTLILILHTFSAGCTALTGVESISNGVPAFKSPAPKNAGKTLIIMAVLMGILFLGSISLTQYLGVVPAAGETILSALARRLLGSGLPYLVIQGSTLLILSVAANTSFAGFPRLAAILAQDGFLPRPLTQVGDRLVYSNGIIWLAVATGVLIVVFNGDPHLLVPLFAVGAFLAFTLSQTGMVVHWWREQAQKKASSSQRGWWVKSFINGIGALATGMTLVVVSVSKFTQGAWLTVLMIPMLVMVFLKIRSHYQEVSAQLTMRGLPPSLRPEPAPRVVVPVAGVHRGVVDAINFARSISDNVTALYLELEPGSGESLRKKWAEWWPDVTLEIVPSPYRAIVGPLLNYLDAMDERYHDGRLAVVVIPELVPGSRWQSILHNQTAHMIRNALLYRRRNLGYQRVIIDMPYHLRG